MEYNFLKKYLIVEKKPSKNGKCRWYCIFWAINKKGFKKIIACTALSKIVLWKLVKDAFEGNKNKPWGKWSTQEVIPALVIPKEWKEWLKFENRFTKKSVKKYTDIFNKTIVWPSHYKLEKYND